MRPRVLRSIAIALPAALAVAAAAPVRGVPRVSSDEARTLTVNGVARRYLLHVPPRLDPRAPAPLVLVFHGFGGSAEQIARDAGFRALADREGFVVAFPDGIDHRWRDGWVVFDRGGADDYAFVRAVLADVARQHPIDARRTYAAGHSNGAFFSQALACRMPGTFAAIAPVSGQLATSAVATCRAAAPVSMLEVHGTADRVVPFDGGRLRAGVDLLSAEASARLRAERAGCRATPRTLNGPDADPSNETTVRREVYDGCADGRAVELWIVDGGSHRWPGSTGARGPLRTRRVGTPTDDFDGASVIWRFFAEHPAR